MTNAILYGSSTGAIALRSVLLAHPGTQYSFQLAKELDSLGLLDGFHTGIAFRKGSLVERGLGMLPSWISRKVANRRLDAVDRSRLHCYPTSEVAALISLHRGGQQEKVLYSRNARFQLAIPEKVIASADAVIGFDTSSWILAARCRNLGVPFILDQSIGHPDSRISTFERIRSQFPDWSMDVEVRLPAQREAEQVEHDLADLIVAASSFSIRTLVESGIASGKIRLNPYGVDTERFRVCDRNSSDPLRFVFVGSVSARKGVPLLLEAWRRLGSSSAELWIVGPVSDQIRRLVPDLPGLKLLGAKPHSEIPDILSQCDVFVFPSFFEGFGLVILEAMACGLPIITTDATAGPDIFQSAEGGWIVPVGDVVSLIEAMEECLLDPEGVREQGRRARTIAELHSWKRYGDRWAKILNSLAGRAP